MLASKGIESFDRTDRAIRLDAHLMGGEITPFAVDRPLNSPDPKPIDHRHVRLRSCFYWLEESIGGFNVGLTFLVSGDKESLQVANPPSTVCCI